MGRSPQSAPLRVMHHRIARCWQAAVVVAILAVAGTAHSADAPPLLSPEQMNASEIQLALQKLNVLGRVLYIAAHPDDENTNLMAFWANGSLYDSAYLSVTRGDCGQNLIGPELGERLGVIRTEELLDARSMQSHRLGSRGACLQATQQHARLRRHHLDIGRRCRVPCGTGMTGTGATA